MPEISRFLGIVIAMFYNDHEPPHFHVRYGAHKATVGIESLSVLDGRLPPRVMGLVVEWASLRRDGLRQDWDLARRQQPLQKIEPLE